jgi:hypothetical protein
MSLQRGINLCVLAKKMGQCSGAEARVYVLRWVSVMCLRFSSPFDSLTCSPAFVVSLAAANPLTNRDIRTAGAAATYHAGELRVFDGEGAEEEPGEEYEC